MRVPWELIAVGVMTSACEGTPAHIEPGAHHETAAARDAPPPPSAPAPVVFRILTAAERTARRAKLATEFGATSVLLDFAGYPTRLEIPVSTEPVDLEATTRALVTAHAESFGIQDPSLLMPPLNSIVDGELVPASLTATRTTTTRSRASRPTGQ